MVLDAVVLHTTSRSLKQVDQFRRDWLGHPAVSQAKFSFHRAGTGGAADARDVDSHNRPRVGRLGEERNSERPKHQPRYSPGIH